MLSNVRDIHKSSTKEMLTSAVLRTGTVLTSQLRHRATEMAGGLLSILDMREWPKEQTADIRITLFTATKVVVLIHTDSSIGSPAGEQNQLKSFL